MNKSVEIIWSLPQKESSEYNVEIICKDPELIGQNVQFRIIQLGKPHSTPGTGSLTGWEGAYQYSHLPQNTEVIWEHFFEITAEVSLIKIPLKELQLYNYRGQSLSILLQAELIKEEQLLTKTEIQTCQDQELEARSRQKITPFEPLQQDNLLTHKALKSLLSRKQRQQLFFVTLLLFIVWPLLSLVGLSETFASLSYSAPTGLLLSSTALIIVVAYFTREYLIDKMLSTLCTLKASTLADSLSKNSQILVSDLFSGQANLDLNDVTIKLFACNIEQVEFLTINSEYNKRQFLNRTIPRAVQLYKQSIAHIPAHQPIEDFFEDLLIIEPIFEELYPPLYLNHDCFLSVELRLHLLHKHLKPIELIYEKLELNLSSFFSKPLTSGFE